MAVFIILSTITFGVLFWVNDAKDSISREDSLTHVETPSVSDNGKLITSPHCLVSCPTSLSSTNKLIRRNIYILSNNPKTKFTDWVAYKVTSDTIGRSKTRRWKADPLLKPENTLEPADYKQYVGHPLFFTNLISPIEVCTWFIDENKFGP